MDPTKLRRKLSWSSAALLVPWLVAGCTHSSDSPESGVAPKIGDGGPSENTIELSEVPDAVPRLEPLSPYGNPPFYEVDGERHYVLTSSQGYDERGIASWYGRKFHGRRASNGETYDMYAMTAAHKTLPLPTYVEVTNLDNGRRAVVRVTDRGPFVKNRLIDLSYTAAVKLGIAESGTGLVEVRAIQPPSDGQDAQGKRLLEGGEPRIYIQVGAFAQRNNAMYLRNRLQGTQIPKIRIQQSEQSGRSLYRVQVGPIDSVEDVDRIAELLTNLGIEKHHVIIN